MGASNSSSALNLWGGTRGAHVVMVGLDASGKTTVLYQLKENRKVVTTPTIGCNVETIEEPFVGLPLTLWDLRGLGQARNFYRTFYLQKEAFVFVLDSSDLDRIAEVAEELQLLASDANLTRLPCLVLANKQDLPGALTPTQVAQALDLHQVFKEERRWHVQGCCAAENRGLRPGFAWLANEILKRRQNLEEIY
ncbi:uncharacterized protein LOC132195687 [Neocloeon triangulifer]|uniref:uncharacterized protein LOC132195687 n=1 Tax=Neocloeon triangulifer TaxID=2078957 RepID=UPI00286FAC53|nr:uncharacterized protein LOC132195687 [Neocloeon triangulifer]